MIPDWGARGNRPHIVFLLVDDWGWDLMPRQPDFRDAVHDRDLERLLPTVSRLFARDGLSRSSTHSRGTETARQNCGHNDRGDGEAELDLVEGEHWGCGK